VVNLFKQAFKLLPRLYRLRFSTVMVFNSGFAYWFEKWFTALGSVHQRRATW